jgi:hypothetical protein
MKNSSFPSSASRSSGKPRLSSRWLGLALLPILAAGCAGTFHEVRTLSPGRTPAERPATLVLGQVQIADARLSATEKELHRLKFQQGVEAWFAKTNAFESVLSGTNVPPGSIVLSGTITEVEKGSAAARFWVGMGAGQARIQGEFEIKDAAGQSLTRFTAQRSYLGGMGIGGGNMLNLEELTFRLGGTVAETIFKWLHGQKLE